MDPSSLHKLEHALHSTEQLSSFGGERRSVPTAVRQAPQRMSRRSPQQVVAELDAPDPCYPKPHGSHMTRDVSNRAHEPTKRCRGLTPQGNACLECGSPTDSTSKLVFSFSQSVNPVFICGECVPLSDTLAQIANDIGCSSEALQSCLAWKSTIKVNGRIKDFVGR